VAAEQEKAPREKWDRAECEIDRLAGFRHSDGETGFVQLVDSPIRLVVDASAAEHPAHPDHIYQQLE